MGGVHTSLLWMMVGTCRAKIDIVEDDGLAQAPVMQRSNDNVRRKSLRNVVVHRPVTLIYEVN